MTKVEDIKDIGVTIDCQLQFEKHINQKIVTANKLVGIIRRSFMFLSEEYLFHYINPLFAAILIMVCPYGPHIQGRQRGGGVGEVATLPEFWRRGGC